MNWKDTIVIKTATLREAIKTIDGTPFKVALIIDSEDRLVGTLTDGDIRRAILKNIDLNSQISTVIHHVPITISEHATHKEVQKCIEEKKIKHLPRVNALGKIVGLEVIGEFTDKSLVLPPVVIMAGGLSTRLRPITNECPKPMLSIGGKPILETIITMLRDIGFKEFYISVNYKAEMITNYFSDGSHLGVTIRYLSEEYQSGTAGSLALLPKYNDQPLLIMNGDVLTKVDFKGLIQDHYDQRVDITMCLREFDFQVPYGVVKLSNQFVEEIDEKPVHSFFINAGIYVVNSKCFDLIPRSKSYHMTQLIKDAIECGLKCSAFPVREYWVDIGQHHDFKRANEDYEAEFR